MTTPSVLGHRYTPALLRHRCPCGADAATFCRTCSGCERCCGALKPQPAPPALEPCPHCGSRDFCDCDTDSVMVAETVTPSRDESRRCVTCSQPLNGARRDARYCSAKCKQRSYRARKGAAR
jgi:hypothetical protein